MDLKKAIQYNERAAVGSWRSDSLPFPWNENAPGTRRFAEFCFIFQTCRNLVADGMLGPKTLAELTAFGGFDAAADLAGESPEAADLAGESPETGKRPKKKAPKPKKA